MFTDRISETEEQAGNDCCRRERLRDLALLTAEVGNAFTKKITYQEYAAIGSHGAEPPEELWLTAFGEKAVKELKKQRLLRPLLKKEITENGLKKAESIVRQYRSSAVNAVIALSNYSTSHTRFRDLLTRVCGCRYASMPLFDISMFEGAMNVDWRALKKRTIAITKAVSKAETITIKTPNGSFLTLSKKGRNAYSDTGFLVKQGSFGNLPAGEVFLAPVEGSAHGRLVLEWAPTRELKSPVTLIVKEGIVKEIIGEEPYAEYLRAKLNERPENRNIAELGIGTNDRAKRPDNILESEKILGTIHIALGDNSSFGGRVKTPFHQDFVFFRPDVVLKTKDGKETYLLKNGLLS
ncbi:MAG: aminopeptidase [Thermodesulfovibrionales bacterium]|nr:aminopeptidase [Thermodesulfovibrionales bacterium]